MASQRCLIPLPLLLPLLLLLCSTLAASGSAARPPSGDTAGPSPRVEPSRLLRSTPRIASHDVAMQPAAQRHEQLERQQQAAEQSTAASQLSANPAGQAQDQQPAEEAYATLLYSDSFLLGVRVLGQSLRESGTTKDMVVLVTGPVSGAAEVALAADGWRVRRVPTLANPGRWTQVPGARYPPAFWGVYTKLHIFNLTEYRTVVYLDADALVVRNLDEAFACPGFCAALRHSERLNSGVMVVHPSAALFAEMLARVPELPSYTGGDQGFLNSYFPSFASAPLFDPAANYSAKTGDAAASALSGIAAAVTLMRLPTVYNADCGLYAQNSNRWMVDPGAIRVLHFTLGPLKPWHWWAGWLVNETARWQAVRERLPATPDGWRAGDARAQRMAQAVLLPLPPLLALLVLDRRIWAAALQPLLCACRRLALPAGPAARRRTAARSAARGRFDVAGWLAAMCPGRARSTVPAGQLGGCLQDGPAPALRPPPPALSVAVGTVSLVASALAGALIVPAGARPRLGWALFYEWSLSSFFALFGGYLRWCYLRGAASAAAAAAHGGDAECGGAGGAQPHSVMCPASARCARGSAAASPFTSAGHSSSSLAAGARAAAPAPASCSGGEPAARMPSLAAAAHSRRRPPWRATACGAACATLAALASPWAADIFGFGPFLTQRIVVSGWFNAAAAAVMGAFFVRLPAHWHAWGAACAAPCRCSQKLGAAD